jgi:hypothetical protein
MKTTSKKMRTSKIKKYENEDDLNKMKKKLKKTALIGCDLIVN